MGLGLLIRLGAVSLLDRRILSESLLRSRLRLGGSLLSYRSLLGSWVLDGLGRLIRGWCGGWLLARSLRGRGVVLRDRTCGGATSEPSSPFASI